MTRRDVFDLLRAGDPGPVGSLDGPESARGRRILATVMATTTTTRRDLRRRRWYRVLVALAIVLASTAAAWYLVSRPVTDPAGTVCYESPEVGGPAVIAVPDGDPAVEDCVSVWIDGLLPIGDPPLGEAPPLVGCVLDSGSLAVFPSQDPGLCQQLGLAHLDLPSAGSIGTLRRALVESITPACYSLEDGRDVVRSVLDGLGFVDWQVVIQDAVPGRPCASVGVDGTNKTIVIVPVP